MNKIDITWILLVLTLSFSCTKESTDPTNSSPTSNSTGTVGTGGAGGTGGTIDSNNVIGYAKMIVDGVLYERNYNAYDWYYRSRRDLNINFEMNGNDPCWGFRLYLNSVHSDYQPYFDGNQQGVITLSLWHPGIDTEPVGNDHVTLLYTGIGACTPNQPYCIGEALGSPADNCLGFLSISGGGSLQLDFRSDAVYCTLTDEVQFWCIGEGGTQGGVYPCEVIISELEWVMTYQ